MADINETNKQELSETDFKALEKEIAHEISNYEYFQANGLQVNLFKHSEAGKEQTMLKLMKGTRVLYVRVFEGYSDEIRYMAYYFLYRDIFNQGLTLMNMTSIQQEELDKQKEIVEKGLLEKKSTEGKIIKLR